VPYHCHGLWRPSLLLLSFQMRRWTSSFCLKGVSPFSIVLISAFRVWKPLISSYSPTSPHLVLWRYGHLTHYCNNCTGKCDATNQDCNQELIKLLTSSFSCCLYKFSCFKCILYHSHKLFI
jgi:hypothetical protein